MGHCSFVSRALQLLSLGLMASAIGCGASTMRTSSSSVFAPRAEQSVAENARERITPKRKALVYVEERGFTIGIFTYPSLKFVDTISIYHGEQSNLGNFCSDKEGHVFVTASGDEDGNEHVTAIYEYAHGKTEVINSLSVSGLDSASCAVDPKTNDLAVAGDIKNDSALHPVLAIFRHGKGQPDMLTDPSYELFESCAYDDQGNLFLTGGNLAGNQLTELPKGGSGFTHIKFAGPNVWGPVVWDGSNIAIVRSHRHYTDSVKYTVYRLLIDGSSATVIGTVTLKAKAYQIGQLWVAPPYAAAGTPGPFLGSDPKLLVWRYPGGGRPMKSVSLPNPYVDEPGATVSLPAQY
jgi:hypothetical protein